MLCPCIKRPAGTCPRPKRPVYAPNSAPIRKTMHPCYKRFVGVPKRLPIPKRLSRAKNDSPALKTTCLQPKRHTHSQNDTPMRTTCGGPQPIHGRHKRRKRTTSASPPCSSTTSTRSSRWLPAPHSHPKQLICDSNDSLGPQK